MSEPGEPGYASAARIRVGVPDSAARTQTGRARRGVAWPLRRTLLGILALLLIAVSAGVGLVSVSVFHASAVQRVDTDLESSARRVLSGLSFGQQQDPGDFVGQPGISAGTVVGVVYADGTIAAQYVGAPGQGTVDVSETDASALADVPVADGVGPGFRTEDIEPVTVRLGDLGDYRALAVSGVDLQTNQQVQVVVALPLGEAESATAQLALTITLVAAAGLLLALVAGWFIVGRALAPLERVTASAMRVSELPLDRGDVELAERVETGDDRTEVGRLGGAFNRMLGHVSDALSAREASERKVRRFVADASHELRTPLASIRGYSELVRLHGGELPEEVLHALGRIESESVRMTDLVEDLLLLARLDEGRELAREPVDLQTIARDAVGDAQAAGPEHEWSLEAPEEPLVVDGDEPRLRQVVVNLLANARVHTPEGTRVRLRLVRDGTSARIEVEDDGPGIPPALSDSLFERFARGDSSRSRRAGSTGLGLAIVQAVVDAHGGTVGVRSEPGETVFSVRLPLADPAGDRRAPAGRSEV
ncbi:sensor histidine kinase [Agromyces seonyuensis]|uniref:histidine kinase n=1 Tax=Agromyces seonyuensis TaxID=2662446 RepID=A0A6I4NTP1_9MICO|nr:HAMP domain-containing sensor histidine kinase [Agromyces seonyuensis]MWB97603.1 HAMP domain-containing protein [Agromyces seonyuensis]